jgi:hypothetical protein
LKPSAFKSEFLKIVSIRTDVLLYVLIEKSLETLISLFAVRSMETTIIKRVQADILASSGFILLLESRVAAFEGF